MKFIAMLILCPLLWSCTSGPVIRETGTVNDQGQIVGSTTIFLGGTLAAKRKGVITQVKKTGKGGWNISYMVESESSESVPMAGMAAWGMGQAAAEATAQEAAKQSTAKAGIKSNETIELGKQSVEKLGIESASEVPKFIPR